VDGCEDLVHLRLKAPGDDNNLELIHAVYVFTVVYLLVLISLRQDARFV
jgi:hypothetical protein